MSIYRATRAQRLIDRDGILHNEITRLPGGAFITFDTYIERKTCPSCLVKKPAAEFLKTWKFNTCGARELRFKDNNGAQDCLTCNPPSQPFPSDLRAIDFYPDLIGDDGKIAGWRQRDEKGVFGPFLSLRTLQVRKVRDIYYPQPKLVRIKNAPRQVIDVPNVLIDAQRVFTSEMIMEAAKRQNWLCALCDDVLLEGLLEGDHIKPYVDGWPTIISNCQAVHGRCNAIKGRRSHTWTRQRIQEMKREGRW